MASSFKSLDTPVRTGTAGAWFSTLDARPGGFAGDPRFGSRADSPAQHVDQAAQMAAAIEAARLEGYEAGAQWAFDQARSAAEAQDAAREGFRMSLTRLDDIARRELAARLAETVTRLCQETLAPLTIDPEALQRRCEAAADAFGEARHSLSLHLNPADIDLLDGDYAANWTIVPDERLARGTLRLEGPDGGLSEGPAEWAAGLRAAFATC